jgi:hypothetical protein
MKAMIRVFSILVLFMMAASCATTPLVIPEKYNLDNDFEAVDKIASFSIDSYENIDKQSLILEANFNDNFLLILDRPRLEITYGKTGISRTGSTIMAGHDRVVMYYDTGLEYYFIEKIYKLGGRKQVTEIKKRLREEEKKKTAS